MSSKGEEGKIITPTNLVLEKEQKSVASQARPVMGQATPWSRLFSQSSTSTSASASTLISAATRAMNDEHARASLVDVLEGGSVAVPLPDAVGEGAFMFEPKEQATKEAAAEVLEDDVRDSHEARAEYSKSKTGKDKGQWQKVCDAYRSILKAAGVSL